MLILGLLLFNADCCKSDNGFDKLPPATQIGNNTFGCLVNGKVWRNEGIGVSPAGNLWQTVGRNLFEITAVKSISNSVYQSIFIEIKLPIVAGKYNISKDVSAGFADAHANCCYRTDSISSSGIIEITKFDTVNFIISGIFNFNVKKYNIMGCNGNCDSIVNVTEGRFDIKYE